MDEYRLSNRWVSHPPPTGPTTQADLRLEDPRMRRAVMPLFGLGCFLALLLVCYRPVLFEGAQFASANASYYYPLDLHVQQEWDAGRWPLWDPGHNAGEPLLGNPMCAVFYPGKVLYTLLPYAWAYRIYLIAHTVLAFLGLLGAGAVVWCELGGIVPGGSQLCIRCADVVPLFQPDSFSRRGLGSVGPVCDRPSDAARAASGRGRAGRGSCAPGPWGRPRRRLPDGRLRGWLCRGAGDSAPELARIGSTSGRLRSQRW